MTPEEMAAQVAADANSAQQKLIVDKAVEIVTALDTPGGRYIMQYLEELYETEAKVDPSKYTSYNDKGMIEVSKETLGMHFGIATMIHSFREFCQSQRAIVHNIAQENSTASETGV